LQRPIRQGQAQMSLPRAWRAEQHEIRAGAHKGEIGQLAQATLGEGGLKRELKAIECLFARDARRFESPSQRLLLTPLYLGAQRLVQKGFIGPLLRPCPLQNLWQGRLR
jgi:hypothetical protein